MQSDNQSSVTLYKVALAAASFLAVVSAVFFALHSFAFAGVLLALAVALVPVIFYTQHLTSSRATRTILRQELKNSVSAALADSALMSEKSGQEISAKISSLENRLNNLPTPTKYEDQGEASAALEAIQRESKVLRKTVDVLATQQESIIRELEQSRVLRGDRSSSNL